MQAVVFIFAHRQKRTFANNTVRFIAQGASAYEIDVADVDPLIVTAAVSFNVPSRCQQNTPYYVNRHPVSKLLPVFVKFRHGLAKQRTIVSSIDGDVRALYDELRAFIPRDKLTISPYNGDIWANGHFKDNICKFLTLRGF